MAMNHSLEFRVTTNDFTVFLTAGVKVYMVKGEIEMVFTLQTDGRKGELMSKSVYDKWVRFILSTLDTEKDHTLHDLLESAHHKFGNEKDHDSGWHILQIKRDLEARGLIRVIAAPAIKRTFFLKLTRQGRSKLHYEMQVSEWSEGNEETSLD